MATREEYIDQIQAEYARLWADQSPELAGWVLGRAIVDSETDPAQREAYNRKYDSTGISSSDVAANQTLISNGIRPAERSIIPDLYSLASTHDSFTAVLVEMSDAEIATLASKVTMWGNLATRNIGAIDSPPTATTSVPAPEIGRPRSVPTDSTSLRQREFILETAALARRVEAESGVPWQAMVLQAGHESGFNLNADTIFGVKDSGQSVPEGADTITRPTWEEVNGQRVQIMADFVRFPTFEAAFEYQGNFLSGTRYRNAFQFAGEDGNFILYLDAVRDAGYATDSRYINKLVDHAQKHYHFMNDVDDIYDRYEDLEATGQSANLSSSAYQRFYEEVEAFREEYGMADAFADIAPEPPNWGVRDYSLPRSVSYSAIEVNEVLDTRTVPISDGLQNALRGVLSTLEEPRIEDTISRRVVGEELQFLSSDYLWALHSGSVTEEMWSSTPSYYRGGRGFADGLVTGSDHRRLEGYIRSARRDDELTAEDIQGLIEILDDFEGRVTAGSSLQRWHPEEQAQLRAVVDTLQDLRGREATSYISLGIAQALRKEGVTLGECEGAPSITQANLGELLSNGGTNNLDSSVRQEIGAYMYPTNNFEGMLPVAEATEIKQCQVAGVSTLDVDITNGRGGRE